MKPFDAKDQMEDSCKMIINTLSRNKQIFRELNRKSFPGDEAMFLENQLISSNKLICFILDEILENKEHLLNSDPTFLELSKKFKKHVESYSNFVKSSRQTEHHVRFPIEFEQLIKKYII